MSKDLPVSALKILKLSREKDQVILSTDLKICKKLSRYCADFAETKNSCSTETMPLSVLFFLLDSFVQIAFPVTY
jgi:hypothetical protein